MALRTREALRQLEEAAAGALPDAGDHLLAASNRKIPVETGELEHSGQVSVDGLIATIKYTDPIAILEHEDMYVHHTAGREAKYLEKAMVEEARAIGEIVAERIRQAIR